MLLINGSSIVCISERAQDRIAKLLCRAASKSTPRTDPSDASLQSQLFPSQNPAQSSTARQKLRQIMLELANSDTFLDLIADKLQSGGVQL